MAVKADCVRSTECMHYEISVFKNCIVMPSMLNKILTCKASVGILVETVTISNMRFTDGSMIIVGLVV